MKRALFSLTVLAAPLALNACLEAGQGARVGATDTATTSDTAADVVGDPCAGKVCDDDDPCTSDACDPATGACVHLQGAGAGRAFEPPECQGAADCDDGDPCTADSCIFVGPNQCGYGGWAYCDNQPVVGCGGCMIAGCDDSDPCTDDSCQSDGTCRYDPRADCLTACSGVGAIDAESAPWTAWPGDATKVAGVAAGYPSQGACYEVGGDSDAWCGVCEYPAGLSSAVGTPAAVRIQGPPTLEGPRWMCTEGCVSECSPMVWGAAYWAWGTASSSMYGTAGATPPGGSGDPQDPAGAPRAPADVLAITGWCLQTNAAGLVGRYSGTLTLAGYTRGGVIPLTAEIHPTMAGGLAITIGTPECTSTGCEPWMFELLGTQTVPLETGDGTVSFVFEVPGLCNAASVTSRVRLESNHNTLSGTYRDAPYDAEATDLGCASGTVTLTREN